MCCSTVAILRNLLSLRYRSFKFLKWYQVPLFVSIKKVNNNIDNYFIIVIIVLGIRYLLRISAPPGDLLELPHDKSLHPMDNPSHVRI